MYFFSIISSAALVFGLINHVKAQDFNKNLNVQAFDYYLMKEDFDQAYYVLKDLDENYDVSLIWPYQSLLVAVKFEDKELVKHILDFAFKNGLEWSPFCSTSISDANVYIENIEPYIKKKLKLDDFSFEKFLGSNFSDYKTKWDSFRQISIADHYSCLKQMQRINAVDQFIRINYVNDDVFNYIDSLNRKDFINWLSQNADVIPFSFESNLDIIVMMRHLTALQFDSLNRMNIWKKLMNNNIISLFDYASAYDYGKKSYYFPDWKAYAERDWKFTGINTKEMLQELNNKRIKSGLLPLEFCAFSIKHNVIPPDSLRCYSNLENYLNSIK
jgi:hypothetical protein